MNILVKPNKGNDKLMMAIVEFKDQQSVRGALRFKGILYFKGKRLLIQKASRPIYHVENKPTKKETDETRIYYEFMKAFHKHFTIK